MVSALFAAVMLCASASARLSPPARGVSAAPVSPTARKIAARGGASYGDFAKNNPAANGVFIAIVKTGLADVMAQLAAGKEFDWKRCGVFSAFGGVYLGMFQYWYQVNIFKKMFKSTERFTSQSWAQKARDTNGLISLACQTMVDMVVLTFVYLPTFYIFKASVFGACSSPYACIEEGYGKFLTNLKADVPALLKCWIPADLLCFSVPLHLRLPIRHVWSFFWTIYLSLMRGSAQ